MRSLGGGREMGTQSSGIVTMTGRGGYADQAVMWKWE